MHCLSESHQSIITSDKGRDWKHRPPPRGVTSDDYILCPELQKCRFGERCTSAHSEEELGEWKERYRYRLMKWQKAKDRQLHGSSFAEQVLEKWLGSTNPTNVMVESIDEVKVTVNSELNISISSKNSAHCWTFTLQCKGNRSLHRIALLHDVHRPHFNITHVYLGDSRRQSEQDIPNLCQEWTIPSKHSPQTKTKDHVYRVKLQFTSQIFGTFRQCIVFDFGGEPYVMKRVSADSVSASDKQKLEEAREKFFSVGDRWDNTMKKVVEFSPKPAFGMEEDEELRCKYRPPRSKEELIPQSVLEKYLMKNNYKTRMHELLYIEELTQFKEMSKYNVRTSLHIISSFLLVPSRGAGARYAQGGELFALLKLNNQLSSDTMGGRLILNNCNSALLATVKDDRLDSIVYEALIEEKSKDAIYFRFSKLCVEELGLKADDMVEVELQFQLNRLPLCEWHYAVDQVIDLELLFPNVRIMPSIPWTPDKQWMDKLDPRINSKQKEAVMAISTPLEISLPPVFLVGPYGTGKTFTLAHATKFILQQKDTRILICTHSNSAADLYIRDYFHAYVEAGNTAARPLRIYFKNRWTQTVHPVVRLYCHMSENEDRFTMPSKEEVEKYRVIVATLSTSRYLNHLNLPQGFFTHILLDEAAQAIECEAVMPLSLANKDTRVVLAGDYMQISPTVYSEFARERNLHISLLERLYDLYPVKHPCKILLCENYRSNEVIVDYTSKLFYEAKLLASGKQPPHPKLYPLTFYTAKGEDIQEKNSTTFYNNAEVFEIAERVQELHKSWPSEWGPMEDGSIGVVTPYSDQVFRIRSELRRRHLHAVSVERVMNVQGKQFRALFISTVRTHHTCPRDVGPKSKLRPRRGDLTRAAGEEADYGFLSNDKLLNTAITRAQSLVAVVGDPVSLCAIGKCRKLWEELIKVCHINDSLHGTTYAAIKAQLSSVEMKKTFILNPMAKEFVPRFNNIMGAPVIQNLSSISSAHSHSNARMVFGFPGQGVRAPSAGNPLFSSQLRHTMPVGPFAPQGMFRSVSPTPYVDRFTGQRIMYVPVIPVPVRMVPNVFPYQYLDPSVPFALPRPIPLASPGMRSISNTGYLPPSLGSPPSERAATPSQDRSEKAGRELFRIGPQQQWHDRHQAMPSGRNLRGVDFHIADSSQLEKSDGTEEHFQELIRPLMQQLQSQKSEDESRNAKPPDGGDGQRANRNGGHVPHDFHTGGAVGMPSLRQMPPAHLKVKLGNHQETSEREPWQDVTLPFSPDRSDTEGPFFNNGQVHKRLGERPMEERNNNKFNNGSGQTINQENGGKEVKKLTSREMQMRNEFFERMRNPPELLVESAHRAFDEEASAGGSLVLHASDTSPRTPSHFLEHSNNNDISLPSPFGESRDNPFGTRNSDIENFPFLSQHSAFNQDEDTTILAPPHTPLDYTRSSSGESFSAFKCPPAGEDVLHLRDPPPTKWWSTNDNYIHTPSPQVSGPSTDVNSFHLSPGSQSSQDSAYQLSPSSPYGGDTSPTATTVPASMNLTLEDTKSPLGSMSYATALRTPKSKGIKSGGSQDGRSNTASPDPLSLIEDLGSRQKGGYYSIF
ncbi:probable helicase with zinc finger domain isoform X3 [Apostichopus japonicus]